MPGHVIVLFVVLAGLTGIAELTRGHRPNREGLITAAVTFGAAVGGHRLIAGLSATTTMYLLLTLHVAGRWEPGRGPVAVPAVDPAVPASARRRLRRIAGTRLRGGQPSAAWANPWKLLGRGHPGWLIALYGEAMAATAAAITWGPWAAAAVTAAAVTAMTVPGLLAAHGRRRWRGRYVSHVALAPAYSQLLARVQAAAVTAAAAMTDLGGSVEDPRPVLAEHEWEVARALIGLTEHAQAGHPVPAGAVDAVAAQVSAAETYAAELAAAARAARARDRADVAAIAEAAHAAAAGELEVAAAGHRARAAQLDEAAAATRTLTQALQDC